MAKHQKKQDARHVSLGVHGAWDVFRKLEWERSVFKECSRVIEPSHKAAHALRLPMYAAINAASTAWSLISWAWFELEHDPPRLAMLRGMLSVGENAQLPQLKEAIRRVHEFDVVHNIAHAAKHAQLGNPTPGLSTDLCYNIYQKGDALFFNNEAVARLVREDGSSDQTMESVLNTVTHWWEHALTELDIADRGHLASPRPKGEHASISEPIEHQPEAAP